MRSILVLLILVMIGLNGKGQSVTTLPDSVLSQCCLEVTLLNGNVTTVDWVFIQYITRDGTGTKLFVEYAPNFGGIQWETQIRIQDDFDDVLARSKFIILPFTVGTTDYGIHRNWIANLEENTTTGGTWIYGRFGTPTKRKFSAVEDYETLKNLLLACRPRAIVVAENGLYTEGDTVRMGGFLIEPTTITTEGHNWMMKDTLSRTEFGIDYLTAETGDTTVYWGRRSGSVRQMVQMGNKYWYNTMKDTVGGLYSYLTHSWNSGDPFLRYQIFNPLDPTSGTAWFQVQRDNSFLIVSNETTNPYYTPGLVITSNSAQIGVNESGSGDPGNGVLMGAFGDGTSNEYLFMVTKAVDNNIATNGQFLQLVDNTNGKVEFATVDLSGYLLKTDTAAMLLIYPSTTGWGLVDGGKTWWADSTKVASRYYVGTNPTTIAANYIATSNGSNLVARNLFDNNTYVGVLNSKPFVFGSQTLVGLPTGVDGYWLDVSNYKWIGRYNSTAGSWIYPLQSSLAGGAGTAGRVVHTDVNGRATVSDNLRWNESLKRLSVGGAEVAGYNLLTYNQPGTGYLGIAPDPSNAAIYSSGSRLHLGSNVTSQTITLLSRFMGVGVVTPGSTVDISPIYSATGDLSGAGFGFRLRSVTYNSTSPTSSVIPLASFASFDGGVISSSVVNTFTNPSTVRIAGAPTAGTNVTITRAWSFYIDSGNSYFGGSIALGSATTPARTLHVTGEARITDVNTDTPTKVLGVDGDGDIGDVTWLNPASNSLGIGTTPTQDLDVNGDVYIRDSTRLTTTPAHSSITGLLTRDANGWIGLVTIGTGLSYSGGVLSATASAPTQILAESYNRITSTSSPQTFSSTIADNLVDQGGTQASFTFYFPASPVDGQILTMTWNNAISTLTLDGNGNTIVGSAVTTAVAGTQRKFKYCGACTTPAWIKIY